MEYSLILYLLFAIFTLRYVLEPKLLALVILVGFIVYINPFQNYISFMNTTQKIERKKSEPNVSYNYGNEIVKEHLLYNTKTKLTPVFEKLKTIVEPIQNIQPENHKTILFYIHELQKYNIQLEEETRFQYQIIDSMKQTHTLLQEELEGVKLSSSTALDQLLDEISNDVKLYFNEILQNIINQKKKNRNTNSISTTNYSTGPIISLKEPEPYIV
jgi:hypothetical protein